MAKQEVLECLAPDEQPVASSILFDKDEGILRYLANTRGSANKDVQSGRAKAFEVLSTYVALLGRVGAAPYAPEIHDTCLAQFRSVRIRAPQPGALIGQHCITEHA